MPLLPSKLLRKNFFNILMQMAPFEPGNTTPVFSREKVYARKFHLMKG